LTFKIFTPHKNIKIKPKGQIFEKQKMDQTNCFANNDISFQQKQFHLRYEENIERCVNEIPQGFFQEFVWLLLHEMDANPTLQKDIHLKNVVLVGGLFLVEERPKRHLGSKTCQKGIQKKHLAAARKLIQPERTHRAKALLVMFE
jgi:hypothetical protein